MKKQEKIQKYGEEIYKYIDEICPQHHDRAPYVAIRCLMSIMCKDYVLSENDVEQSVRDAVRPYFEGSKGLPEEEYLPVVKYVMNGNGDPLFFKTDTSDLSLAIASNSDFLPAICSGIAVYNALNPEYGER